MAEFVGTNRKLWFDGYDLSGDLQSINLQYAADEQNADVYGLSTHKMVGGLKTAQLSYEGLWNGGNGEIDDLMFDQMGVSDKPITIGPTTGADGESAYFFNAMVGSYNPGAPVGDLLQFSVDAYTQSNLVRGRIMANVTGATSTSDGTGRQLGAVGASQKLYASLHILSAGTGTIDVIVESDASDSWSGSETTRITFAQASAIGSQWATPVSGAITDTWWRIGYTIAGGAPDFDFVVAVGIL